MKPLTKDEVASMESTHANRSLLISALRNLPEGFTWDYGNPCRCAMGLGVVLGLTKTEHAGDLAEAIGAERDEVHAICYYTMGTRQTPRDVTAGQIAERFERLP